MVEIILTFFTAFVATFLIVPLVIKVALRYRIGSIMSEHSIHRNYIPTLGGVAIFFGFVIGLFLIKYIIPFIERNFFGHFFGLVIGSFLVMIEGIYDDIKGANYFKKFGFQIVASLVVIWFGYRIEFISNPFGDNLYLGIFSIPITILWIMGITNAINLIDGLDGLAAGIGAIASLTFFAIAYKLGDSSGVLISVLLLGATLAFLLYNFNPAKVFMGDVGSQFIGFILACISIESFFGQPSSSTVFIPLIVLAIPILDTTISFTRRIFFGKHPFRGDKYHIHHYILGQKLGYKSTVFCFYGATLLLGIAAFLLVVLSSSFIAPILAVVVLFIFVTLYKIGYPGYIFYIRNKKKDETPS